MNRETPSESRRVPNGVVGDSSRVPVDRLGLLRQGGLKSWFRPWKLGDLKGCGSAGKHGVAHE